MGTGGGSMCTGLHGQGIKRAQQRVGAHSGPRPRAAVHVRGSGLQDARCAVLCDADEPKTKGQVSA